MWCVVCGGGWVVGCVCGEEGVGGRKEEGRGRKGVCGRTRRRRRERRQEEERGVEEGRAGRGDGYRDELMHDRQYLN